MRLDAILAGAAITATGGQGGAASGRTGTAGAGGHGNTGLLGGGPGTDAITAKGGDSGTVAPNASPGRPGDGNANGADVLARGGNDTLELVRGRRNPDGNPAAANAGDVDGGAPRPTETNICVLVGPDTGTVVDCEKRMVEDPA
ncbi:hypothetical protein ACFPM3_15920 [Streptomyces coeruleoprunus]|uniref:Uncharacterized protein n=1 Tax=Streptomyces coeruleoprunus TaxID=285563 RepID=A0ABV9XDY3_9ACTN